MEYLKWANDTFIKDIYATQTTGIVIEDVKENYAKCSLKVDDRHLNAVNNVMGGAIFTLADFTFAIASNTAGFPTVSLSSQINYLNPVKGECLIAETICIKNGKNVCVFDIIVTDNLGNTIATVSTTGFRKAN